MLPRRVRLRGAIPPTRIGPRTCVPSTTRPGLSTLVTNKEIARMRLSLFISVTEILKNVSDLSFQNRDHSGPTAEALRSLADRMEADAKEAARIILADNE